MQHDCKPKQSKADAEFCPAQTIRRLAGPVNGPPSMAGRKTRKARVACETASFTSRVPVNVVDLFNVHSSQILSQVYASRYIDGERQFSMEVFLWNGAFKTFVWIFDDHKKTNLANSTSEMTVFLCFPLMVQVLSCFLFPTGHRPDRSSGSGSSGGTTCSDAWLRKRHLQTESFCNGLQPIFPGSPFDSILHYQNQSSTSNLPGLPSSDLKILLRWTPEKWILSLP